MGNNSSTQAVSPSHPQDASTIASTEAETSSGVFLTNELQGKKVVWWFNKDNKLTSGYIVVIFVSLTSC